MRCPTLLMVGLLVGYLFSQATSPTSPTPPATREIPIGEILGKMADAYRHKVVAGAAERVQIDIHPELEHGFVDRARPALESWHVTVTPDRQVTLAAGLARNPTYLVFTTRTGLRALYEGRFNVMTSQLRSRSRDPAYIEYTRAPGIELTPAISARIRQFIHFFDTSVPHRYVLSGAHARIARLGSGFHLRLRYRHGEERRAHRSGQGRRGVLHPPRIRPRGLDRIGGAAAVDLDGVGPGGLSSLSASRSSLRSTSPPS